MRKSKGEGEGKGVRVSVVVRVRIPFEVLHPFGTRAMPGLGAESHT